MIPILSDPTIGWDLFGTKLYLIKTGFGDGAPHVVHRDRRHRWRSHVVAVYLAHTQAPRLFPDRVEALRSQTPLVALMIAYSNALELVDSRATHHQHSTLTRAAYQLP